MTTSSPTMPIQDAIPAPKACVSLQRAGITLVALGVILSIIALVSETARIRFGFGYLLGFTFIWSIMVGSLFFIALQHITHSIWSVLIRRAAEALASPMILIPLLFIPVLIFTLMYDTFHMFPWTDAGHVEGDPLLEGKVAYLNIPFFIVRAIVFIAIWVAFARFYVNTSLKQDKGLAGVDKSLRMRKVSAPFMLLFAATVTFAGFDWLMSLEPHWFSTMFGVYVFAGVTLSSLAAITLFTIWQMSSGRMGSNIINGDHLYSLGALLFAFTCFWGYVAFSQYMLIWYANIPEETFYIHDRLQGGWLRISILLALLRFVVPFLLLLSRRAKMNPQFLVLCSILVLVGQFIDLYWIIMPSVHHEGPALGWQEIGPVILLIGLPMIFLARFMRLHPPMAIGDPLIEESRRFHL